MKHIIVIHVANPANGIAHDLLDVNLDLVVISPPTQTTLLLTTSRRRHDCLVLREAGIKYRIGDRV
ncbi:MAG: hypothetical protein CM1200mP29_09970 [Verrucomicrobiota bacterium]|nr:MAG: hypothetical protein CM1200mP29_09970 [Verrucomicrobiota bacterium]